MRLSHPYLGFLFLLPLCAAFFLIRIRRKNARDLQKFVAAALLSKVTDAAGARLRLRRGVLRIACLFFLVLALTGPELGYRWREINGRGLEIIFALDTSKSMLAADIQPNRLERAKLAIKQLMPQIAGNKVGLVAFAGTAFLQAPLTADFTAFGAALDSLGVQSIPRGGTAIGAALQVSLKAFQSGEAAPKIVILMTDGENHEGDPVSIAQTAAKQGINIYTVGIGSTAGVPIPIAGSSGKTEYLKDTEGKVVRTVLDEKTLRAIAAAGKGTYIHGDGVSLGLNELYRAGLSKYRRKPAEVSGGWRKEPVNRYQWPLGAAIILLVTELCLGRVLFGKTKSRKEMDLAG